MKKTLSALVISSLLFGANVQAAALSADQEKEVRALVRDTLIKNPEILEEAITALQAQKADEQQAQFRTALKAEHDALYNDAASPRIGAKDAKLVLVSFTDYNCPYCKRFDPLLEKITKDYPEVAVVIKPLPFKGESSAKASQAVLSVWKEDPKAFLALHQRLMQKKTMLDNASIDDAMKTTNTSKVKLTDESLKALQNNLDLSRKLGIQGTPATVVSDMVIPGAVDYAQLEVIVKEQLAKVKK
ncbi:DsbA family protein [Proteus terrae]|uniref:DsbA family protein n=1 Tax=Proteus terrae TaxID=1574161 RepID=UPI0028728D03|nr:DsbA family protein [Proteus terrae]MDR9740312.1 DsbA family protein [Proteus terrae]